MIVRFPATTIGAGESGVGRQKTPEWFESAVQVFRKSIKLARSKNTPVD